MLGGRCRRGVGRRESGGKASARARLDWAAHDRIAAGQSLCGRDRIRTCVGNAGDFTGRTAITPRIPSHPDPVPIIGPDVHKRPVDSFRRPSASPPVPARLAQPRVGRRESGEKAPPTPGFEFRTDVVSGCNARRSVVDRAAPPPDRASAVLVVVVGWVSVVVGALTGLLGWLSTARLTVVPTAAGSGAQLLPAVRQREPGPGGERCVVGAEVGEERPAT
jgi:hypothetical protein